jgi:uncharacterized protein
LIVLDTSAIFSAANRADRDHDRVVAAITSEIGPLVLPVPILSEIGYMLEVALGGSAIATFLRDVEGGRFVMDCCPDDAPAVRQLVERYSDMPLGLADAYVATCARRGGGRVMTLDRRHFDVLGREFKFGILP